MDADYGYGDGDPANDTTGIMREVWLCGHCGAENTPRAEVCVWCHAELDAAGWLVRDADEEAEEGYDLDTLPIWPEGADWDTDEELPCLHADGCPGHRRCLVCL